MLTVKNLKIAIESGGKRGKVSIGKAMRDAGFSKRYANNPQELTRTPSFQKLMKDILPDDFLANLHKDLLSSKRVISAPFHNKLKDDEIKALLEGEDFRFIGTKRFMTTAIVYFAVPDTMTRGKMLELAYKVRGKMAAEVHEHYFEDMTSDQLVNFVIAKISQRE